MTDEALFYIFSSYASITFKSSAIVNSASVAALISSVVTSFVDFKDTKHCYINMTASYYQKIHHRKDKGTFKLSCRMLLYGK